MFEWLSRPGIVDRMIVSVDFNIPAISMIVADLEKECENNVEFKLDNMEVRKSIGKFIGYIISEYDYSKK